MKEGAESFWEWWKEKTSSSVYFTFLIAFCAWNWKGIFVLLSDGSTQNFSQKLNYIYGVLYPGTWVESHAYSLLLPVASTVVLVWVMPYLNTIVHKHENAQHYKRLQNDTQNRIDSLEKAIHAENLEREKLLLQKKNMEDQQKRYDAEYAAIAPKSLADIFTVIKKMVESEKLINDKSLSKEEENAIDYAKAHDFVRVHPGRPFLKMTDKGEYFIRKLRTNLGDFFSY